MNNLTKLESFTVTAELIDVLDRWNQSGRIGYQLGARVVGFFGTIGTGAIDVITHTALFGGKTLTGIIVSPLNLGLKNPKLVDFELSSALVHLSRAVNSLFNIAILPLITLWNPSKAHALILPNAPEQNEESYKLKQDKNKSGMPKKLPKRTPPHIEENHKLKNEVESLHKQHAKDLNEKSKLHEEIELLKETNQSLLNALGGKSTPIYNSYKVSFNEPVVIESISSSIPFVSPSSSPPVPPPPPSITSKPVVRLIKPKIGQDSTSAQTSVVDHGDVVKQALGQRVKLKNVKDRAPLIEQNPPQETELQSQLRKRKNKINDSSPSDSTPSRETPPPIEKPQISSEINLSPACPNGQSINLEESIIISKEKPSEAGHFAQEPIQPLQELNKNTEGLRPLKNSEKNKPVLGPLEFNTNPLENLLKNMPVFAPAQNDENNNIAEWDKQLTAEEEVMVAERLRSNAEKEGRMYDYKGPVVDHTITQIDLKPKAMPHLDGQMNPEVLAMVVNLIPRHQKSLLQAQNNPAELSTIKGRMERTIQSLKEKSGDEREDETLNEEDSHLSPNEMCYSVVAGLPTMSPLTASNKMKYYEEALTVIKKLMALRNQNHN